MYAVVLTTGIAGQTLVFGPFATAALAKTWISQQANPFQYVLSPCYTLPSTISPGGASPVSFSAGSVLVADTETDFNGALVVWLYGTFTDEASANAWIADQINPQIYQAVTVEAPRRGAIVGK